MGDPKDLAGHSHKKRSPHGKTAAPPKRRKRDTSAAQDVNAELPLKRSALDPRSRALGLLSILISERLGLKDKQFWLRVGVKWTYNFWKAFRRGECGLSEDDAAQLADGIKRLLAETARQDPNHILTRDLTLLRAGAFDVLDSDYLRLFGRDDRTEFDHDFLKAYHIRQDSQDSRTFQECAHGFWFLIRRSTVRGATDRYSVWLLSINSNAYTRLTGPDRKPEQVVTSVPHFSLRTGFASDDATDNEKIFRGQVIQTFEPRQMMNFIGTMDIRYPSMFMMTLRMNEIQPHATEAHGVITTSIKSAIISGPVAACYVPLSEEIEKIRGPLTEKKRGTSVELSMAYRRQREILETYVGRHTENELNEKLAPLCSDNAVKAAIRRLSKAYKEARDDAFAGYYHITNG